MSSGDPDPQIPPMPDRTPEQAQQEHRSEQSAWAPQSQDGGTDPGPDRGTDHSAETHGPAHTGAPPAYGSGPTFDGGAAAQAPGSHPTAPHPPAPQSPYAPQTGGAQAAGPTGEVPQPAPAPGYAPGQAAATRKQERKKGTSKMPLILSLSAVGLVLVLVVVGALIVMNVNRSQYGPETVAQEYLDAVAAGDLAAAQEITPATVPNGANESLVDPDVFAASTSAIEDIQVSEADIDGDTATMTAAYTIDGQDYELPLTADKSGRQGVFFDQWTLQPPVLQTLSVNLTQTADATMNGEPVDLATGATEYAVMPGAYELVVPETTYTEEGSSGITVGFAPDAEPQPATLNVTIDVTDAYKEDVTEAVDKKLDECLESGDLETECGFFDRDSFANADEKETYDTLKSEGVEYEMTEKPQIVVTDYGVPGTGSFYTDDENPGEVEAEVEDEDGAEYTLTSELRPSGTVTVDGDSISISFLYNG